MPYPLEVAEDMRDCSCELHLRAAPELHGIVISPGDHVRIPFVFSFAHGKPTGWPMFFTVYYGATIAACTKIQVAPHVIASGKYRNVDRLPVAGDQVWTGGEWDTMRLCGMPEHDIEIMQEAARRFLQENR